MQDDKKMKELLKRTNPFNISLLNLNQDNLYKQLSKVTSTQMFVGANYHLHPEGLWSNEIFGQVGTPERMKKQAYIDLSVSVLHPVLYKELISSSRLIDEIMAGQTYAVFDKNTKFFEKSNAIDGETGYEFFMSHFDEMQLPDTGSPKRKEVIKLIEKHKAIAKIDKLIVLQAGYRDIEFKNGQVSHDEVNQIYREIMSLANSISGSHKSNLSSINTTRYSIQKAVLKLYIYLGEIAGHGKKKLIQDKWSSRVVFNGTANVITAAKPSGRFTNDPRNLGYNDVKVGLFQALVAALPFAVKGIKESFLSEKFADPSQPVILVNKKTLKAEEVSLSQEWFDLFQSDEGIKKLIQRFRPVEVRHRYVEVDGYYLALIYKGEDGSFKIINSISDLPEDKSRDNVSPITLMELLYISTAHLIDRLPCTVTRYPITGISSIPPSFVALRTTVKDEERHQLNDLWEKDELTKPFLHFPIYQEETISSMSPPTAALSGMGGDFDGDVSSLIIALTQEAQDEIREYKKQKRAYIGPDGRVRYGFGYDTIDFICANLSVFDEEPK